MLITLTTLLLHTFVAQSFTLNNNVEAKFQGDFVAVNFSASSNCENTGRSAEKIRGFIDLALKQYWNTVVTSDLDIRPGSSLSKGTNFETDPLCTGGINDPCSPNPTLAVDDGIFIACNSSAANFSSTAIAGATLTNNIDQDKLKGAVIVLNNRTGSLLSAISDDTFVSIIAHEIGHAFGLGHSPHKENLMYYSTIEKRLALGWDDIEAVTYLYPRQDKLFGLIGCDFIDLNAQNPTKEDQHLKVYHDEIGNPSFSPQVSVSFIFSMLLGLGIFPLGLGIARLKKL